MTIQLAVRLPEPMVASMDQAIANGWAVNRTRLIVDAVEREMRRLSAENDLRILQQETAKDDLDDLVTWTATNLALDPSK